MRSWFERHPFVPMAGAIGILAGTVLAHVLTVRSYPATDPRWLMSLAGVVFTALAVGIFSFWWHAWRTWTERDQPPTTDDLTAMAEIMCDPGRAVSLLGRHRERLDQRLIDLERVTQWLLLFNYTVDLDRQMRTAVELALEVLPIEAVSIHLVEESRRFRFRAGGRREGRGAVILPEDAPLIVRHRQRLETLVDVKHLAENRFNGFGLPMHREPPADDLAVRPIQVWNRIHGVAVVQVADPSGPDAEADRLLGFFLGHLGLTIENHQLFAERLQHDRLSREVQLARSIQQDSLPRDLPGLAGFDLFGLCNPCHEISGDYYDVIRLDADRLLIAIADVSGKGVGAALFLARIQTLVRALCPGTTSPAALLQRIATHLGTESLGELFATMQLLLVERGRTMVVIASAGHCRPMVCRVGTGFVEEQALEVGLPVGLFATSGQEYRDTTISLIPGDGVLLFTDGVPELANPEGERFGVDRLRETLETAPADRAMGVVYHVMDALNRYKGNRTFDDDVTMVYIRLEPERRSSHEVTSGIRGRPDGHA